MNKLPIIIDTDAGHDDALAIMLLERSRMFDIRAITTVAGNSTIRNVTRNAAAVLDLLNARRIPIYSGGDAPLDRPLVQAVVHGESGLDGLDMSHTTFSLTGDAPQQIIDLVRANPGELTILTLGPLTNIARALEQEPAIASQVKSIVMMGGAITVPGNKNRVAEFNMFVDPEAADIVFRSAVPKVLVPLDPCNDIIISAEKFEQLKGTPLYKPITSMMQHFIAGLTADEGVTGVLAYDVLAAYYLVRPAAFETEPMDIVVETAGMHTSGMTIAERRTSKPKVPNVSVVTGIDKKQFEQDLFTLLKQSKETTI